MSIFAPKLEVVISVIQFQFSSSIKKLKLPPLLHVQFTRENAPVRTKN